MRHESRPGLHGWGYQGRSVDDLVEFAAQVGAETVVDVRLTPISRRKGFSKRKLADGLAAADIAYLHLRELGNPRENRGGFAFPGSEVADAAHSTYQREVLELPAAVHALDQIRALIPSGVILLCFEADSSTCHRQLVIDALATTLEDVLV